MAAAFYNSSVSVYVSGKRRLGADAFWRISLAAGLT